MTDQTETTVKKQKPGLLRRALWWVWVGLLCVVLAGAVFFAAPWKVISLLAIFLAAATILPRHLRKWFWLGVGIVIISLIAWGFLPTNEEGWRPYTFDKELAQLQTRYGVPDAENAALVYEKLAEATVIDENEPEFFVRTSPSAKSEPWTASEHPETAAWLRERERLIDKVIEATRMDRCAFPIASDPIKFGDAMKRFGPMRQWAYLLIASGNNAMAEGKLNEALEKYLALLRMGHHLSQQPIATDVMVGMAIENLGLGGINRFIVREDVNESCLSKVEQTTSEIKHDLSSDLPGFIDSEKLMLKNTWGGLSYEVDSKGKVRLSRDPWALMREQAKGWLANGTVDDAKTRAAMQRWIFPGYWWKRYARIQTILSWFYAPATPEKLSQIVNESFEKHYLMTKPDFDWSKEPNAVPMESLFQYGLNFRQNMKLMALSNKQVYFGLHDTYLRKSAEQRGTLLIIAMRRYKNTNGHWPQQLEDAKNFAPTEIFVDPLNGGTFVYKRTDDSFTLYSKGNNGIDEGGEHEVKFSDDYSKWKTLKDDYMIWPRRHKSCDGKEEGAKGEQDPNM